MKYRIKKLVKAGGYHRYMPQAKGDHWWNIWHDLALEYLRSQNEAKEFIDRNKERTTIRTEIIEV